MTRFSDGRDRGRPLHTMRVDSEGRSVEQWDTDELRRLAHERKLDSPLSWRLLEYEDLPFPR